jgi:hypothetical protein
MADALVAREPDRPANWLARTTAYWVRSCSPGDTDRDTAVAIESAKKYESMLQPDDPGLKRMDAWVRSIEKNDLRRSGAVTRVASSPQRPKAQVPAAQAEP